jgi:hypothetical protein
VPLVPAAIYALYMKSRHTTLVGSLARSFGIDEENATDLVAEFRDDGTIAIREEPVDRKLKRGEKLPEVVINIRETWDAGKKKANNAAAAPKAIESAIDRVIARLPIADLSGSPDKVGYNAKAWLMNELQKEFHPNN